MHLVGSCLFQQIITIIPSTLQREIPSIMPSIVPVQSLIDIHLESPTPEANRAPGLPVLRQVCTLHQMREVTFYYQKLRPLLTGAWIFVADPTKSSSIKKLSWVIQLSLFEINIKQNMCTSMLRHIHSDWCQTGQVSPTRTLHRPVKRQPMQLRKRWSSW